MAPGGGAPVLPQALLTVRVIEAEHVPRTDLLLGKPDAFVM